LLSAQTITTEYWAADAVCTGTGTTSTDAGQDKGCRGKVKSITNALGQTTQYEAYDAHGRPLAIRKHDGLLTTMSYTSRDWLASMAVNGKTTNYEYDGVGLIKTATFSNGTELSYQYDNAHRLTRVSDNLGNSISYVLDSMGNRVSEISKDPEGNVKQQLARIVNNLNRVTQVTEATTAPTQEITTTYEYDAQGNRIEYTYDAVGRVQSVTLQSNNESTTLMSDISYNHFTDVNGWTWGNGSKWYRQYDLNGRVTGYPLGATSAGGLVRTVVYDAVNRIRAMTHTGDGSGPQSPTLFDQRFEYDDLNRLTQFTVNNLSQTYLYDANGNRPQVQQGAAGYANDIALTSNRLQRAAGPEGTRNFTYDAEGNIKTDGTLSFEFALHGRMRSVNSPAGKTTYWYNALGQRVRKTGQDTTYYFYDGEGRVLGEYDRNSNAIQETVYLDNMPVVVLKQEQGNTVPYYIYADHIHTACDHTRQ
jgi:YD repeat-containing protein